MTERKTPMANVLYVPEGTLRVKPYAYTARTDI